MAASHPPAEHSEQVQEEFTREFERFRVIDLGSVEVTIVHGPRGPEAQLANGHSVAPLLQAR
jgi:hypothetical protein